MEFFKANTKIPFMKQRKWAAIFSVIIFLASIAALISNGLNLGLDFTGGTQIEVSFPAPVEASFIRSAIDKQGFPEAVVQAYNIREYSIRIGIHNDLSQELIKQKVKESLPNVTISAVNFIGPQVGKTLMTNGILAIIVSLICTMIYIALRFEYRFALSAAIALIHDPVLILGIFSFFHLEFNLIVLAAVLTVIGYSLNDTIVVYDRVRENFRKIRKGTSEYVMDLSINQTLSRTIMTSGLTLMVVIALFVFGGPTLRPFALALIIGIIIGTYSSIYVAGALAMVFGLDRASLIPVAKAVHDDLP